MAQIERRELDDGSVRWRMRVFVGRVPDKKTGKLRRRFVTKTFDRKKDAEKEARRLERQKDQGMLAQPTKETLSEYLTRWLDAKAMEVRESTIYGYRSHMRTAIQEPPEGAPPLGAMPVQKLTTAQFNALYSFMWKERGLSHRTIRYTHTIVRQALKDAVRTGILPRNPTDHVKLPRRNETDGEEVNAPAPAMNEEQAGQFLEAAKGDRYFALWALLLTGGLRPSEAFGLKWDDVDLEAGSVHVTRGLTRHGVEGWRLRSVKTKKSRRTVPLPAVTADALRSHRKEQAKERLRLGAEYVDHGFVFATEFGSPLDGGNLLTRNFRAVMAAARLGEWGPEPEKPEGQPGPKKKRPFNPAFRMYDLRHTCATLLLKRGVHPKIVSERLGHTNISITLDTYSHVLPSMQDGAVEELQTMFGDGS